MRHAASDGLTKATCRRGSEAYAGSVPYEASNMQKGAGAAGARYARSWRGLLGVRFAKWWGWWGAGLRHGMGVGSLATARVARVVAMAVRRGRAFWFWV